MIAIAFIVIAAGALLAAGVALVLHDERHCDLCGGKCRTAYHTDQWRRVRSTPVTNPGKEKL
jgi:hypothetical protein